MVADTFGPGTAAGSYERAGIAVTRGCSPALSQGGVHTARTAAGQPGTVPFNQTCVRTMTCSCRNVLDSQHCPANS